ncbi:MAG: FHA domain-containing protein [Planctomycetota bacterium]
MLVLLEAISGPSAGRRVQLRTDQVLKVGSSGWADFSIPEDDALIDVHFEVHCLATGCTIRALSQDAPTQLNGEAIASHQAYDGDELTAGGSKFRVSVKGGPARPADEEPEQPSEESSDKPALSDTAAAAAAAGLVGVCAYLELGDDIGPLAEASNEAPDDLIDKLVAEKKHQEAIRLRAYLLPKREAVWWGCCCLRDHLDEPLPEDQAAAVDAAAEWVENPDETRRRFAEQKAAKPQYSGPGAMLALGAFWSEGSLAPEGSPEVKPDSRLTSQGVTSSLVTAAYLGDPGKAPDRLDNFLSLGKAVAEGGIPLPGNA